MAHQETTQVEEKVLKQVLGLTSTHVCLNVGSDSAKRLEDYFAPLDHEDLSGLVAHQAGARFKYQSNQSFTFSTVELSKCMDIKNEDIARTKKAQYARYYRHVDGISREIDSRYTLVEKNRPTDEKETVKKGEARSKLKKKGGGPFGKTAG
jgi:hypothetical protein